MRPHDRFAAITLLSLAAVFSFAFDAHAADPLDSEEPARARVGFNINGGIGSGQNVSGPVLGSTIRVGWQFNRLTAVYGQLSPYIWLPSRGHGSSLFAAGCQFTPMISLTPRDVIELAAGPSLDLLTSGASSSDGNASGPFSGRKAAIHLRVAIHVVDRNPETGRRKGFTFGLDLHPTFAEGGWFTFYTLGLGYDWY